MASAENLKIVQQKPNSPRDDVFHLLLYDQTVLHLPAPTRQMSYTGNMTPSAATWDVA